MANLVDTTEMYLRTVLDLEEEGITPLRARISERLGHSGPTVSQTVARMERDGLIEVAADRTLVLTDEGRTRAVRVLRKHRIAEGLLANIIGLDLDQVHDEACRWEHVMSDEAEERIFVLLGRPNESPYGTPIPGLTEFGAEESESFLGGVARLSDVATSPEPIALTVRRLGEPVQADTESLSLMRRQGIMPGAHIQAETRREGIAVFTPESDEGVVLPRPVAEHVYVIAGNPSDDSSMR